MPSRLNTKLLLAHLPVLLLALLLALQAALLPVFLFEFSVSFINHTGRPPVTQLFSATQMQHVQLLCSTNLQGPGPNGSEEAGAQTACACSEGAPVWAPSYPGQNYEVPIYSESSDEEDDNSQAGGLVQRTGLLTHPVVTRQIVSIKRGYSGSAVSPAASPPPPSLPTPSEVISTAPGSYTLSMGVTTQGVVRVIKSSGSILFVSPVDCLHVAGFSDPRSILRRLAKRFGPFVTSKMVFNGRSSNQLNMVTIEESVRMLEFYIGVCRTDTQVGHTVIKALKAYFA